MTKLRVLSLFALGILVCAVVSAGCSGGGSNSTTITLAPSSGQSLNPGATVTITAVVANDTNAQGVTWTLSGPGSLSGNTKTSVVYTAPATVSTSTTATVTATSVANSTITATESITLNAVLTITTTSLPSGTLGVPYNAFVNAAGATGTFTWTVTSGNLPPGLTFLTTSTSSSAEITGTPTVLGTSKFTVQVTDTAGTSVTQALSITINVPPAAVGRNRVASRWNRRHALRPTDVTGEQWSPALQLESYGWRPAVWAFACDFRHHFRDACRNRKLQFHG